MAADPDTAARYGASPKVAPAVPHAHTDGGGEWERRDVVGVHAQRQAGYVWVGAAVPAGRLEVGDLAEIARVAEIYGDGSVRLTCEENVVFANVPEDKVEAMLSEPLFLKLKVFPGEPDR